MSKYLIFWNLILSILSFGIDFTAIDFNITEPYNPNNELKSITYINNNKNKVEELVSKSIASQEIVIEIKKEKDRLEQERIERERQEELARIAAEQARREAEARRQMEIIPTITAHANGNSMVTIAASQIGNYGGQPYWSWYGFNGRVEWCATFVSWVANEAGYLNTYVPKFAGVRSGANWYMSNGRWGSKNSYTPKPGDIIFFDWNYDGYSDHVGIVEKVENGRVFAIEGNSEDAVRYRNYSLNSDYVIGYGVIGN